MELEFFVLSIESERIGGRDIIKIIGRDISGNRITLYDKNYWNYFYILPKSAEVPEVAEKIKEFKIKTRDRIIRPKNVEIVRGKILEKEKELIKITVNATADINYIIDEVKKYYEKKTYERDLNIERHYFIDKGLSPLQKIKAEVKKIGENKYELIRILEYYEETYIPKIVAFDIETYNPHGMPDYKEDPVILISLYYEKGPITISWKRSNIKNVIYVENEKALFYKFLQVVREIDPDIIVGYNSDTFDFLYLKNRAEVLGINFEILGEKMKLVRRGRDWVPKFEKVINIDLFTFIKNIISPRLKTEVLNLDAVAKEILGEGKLLEKHERNIMGEIWDKGEIDKLVEYNQKDAELTYRLFEEFKEFVFELTKLVGQNLYDVTRMTYGQLVEWYLMKKLKEKGEILLNRPKDEEIRERQRITYTGAFVYEPKPGIYENIICIDFKSLYPTIMITYNISPENKMCEHEECKENGIEAEIMGRKKYIWFCRKRKGYIAKILEKIFVERSELKKKLRELKKGTEEYKILDAKQYALKTIMNATYGYFGFPNARYYDVEIAASVTAFGRKWISKVIEEAKKEGFLVVYGDTDSVFIAGKPKEEGLKFLEKINKMLPGVMQMDFEDFYPRGIWIVKKGEERGAKKKYALINEKGELTIKGLEIVRRDWAKIAKIVQENVIRMILEGKKKEEIINWIKKILDDVKNHKRPIEEFVIYEQITRELEKYTAKNIPHLAAARRLERLGYKLRPGIVIGYVIVEGGGSISDRAFPVEMVIKEGMTYDAKYYIEHQIIPAIERILEATGISTAEILGKGKQVGLVAFFRGKKK